MTFKKIYKYRIIIILVIIIVFMGITKIRYRNVDWGPTTGLITPTVMPTSAPQINVDYPLWELLPYKGNDYIVDRYTEPGILAVKTIVLNKKVITQEIYDWMIENNVATESHKLIFEKGL